MAHYKNFSWYNQPIDGNVINSVSVRLFPAPQIVTPNAYQQLIATDGKLSSKRFSNLNIDVTDYSYVILSSGIIRRRHQCSEDTSTLRIKLYLTSVFLPSMLDNVEFLGKPYVMEALNSKDINFEKDFKFTNKAVLNSFPQYLKTKIGSDYQKLFSTLKTCARQQDYTRIEQFFKLHNISPKYQAIFWKELYQETIKNMK